MRKIFLDVGANTGQSLEAALCYEFDTIYCFDPVPIYYEMLQNGMIASDRGFGYQMKERKDNRVVICPFGLWSTNGKMNIHSPHTMAASVFSDHQDSQGGTVLCDFVVASEWFAKNIRQDDLVIMKLNCEGAECTIVEDLIRSNELRKVSNFMIDFDAHKIPSEKHMPQIVLKKLAEEKYDNFVLCDHVMHGPTHFDRICNWLNTTHLVKYANPK